MTDFTPGPWHPVFEDDPRGQPVPYYRGLVCIIADGDQRISVVADRDCTSEEWAANALLLASAPELLEALKAYVAVTDIACLVEHDSPDADLASPLRLALAAIAKATGADQ